MGAVLASLRALLTPGRVGMAALAVAMAFPDAGPLSVAPPWLSIPLAAGCLLALLARESWATGRLQDQVAPKWLEGLAVGWALVVFVLLKVPGIHPSGTDDNIYFYMARRFAQGAIPYRDFFFSHPPVHLLVPALLFLPAGFDLTLAKSIPVAAQVAAALWLWRALRPHSRALAVAALVLHLFAYQVLMGSTDMNGENLMTAFLAASLWAVLRRRPLAAGALASLALGCGLYALAGVATLGLAAAWTSGRRGGGRFLGGLAAVTGLWVGVFWALGGAAFWEGVVAYHLAKAVSDPGKVSLFQPGTNPLAAWAHNLGVSLFSRDFLKFLHYHALLYLGLAGTAFWIGVVALRRLRGPCAPQPRTRRERRREAKTVASRPADPASPGQEPWVLPALGVAGTALFECQWAALAETYDFYRVPMSPFLAIAAAWALVRAARAVPHGGAPGWLGLAAVGVMAAHPWLSEGLATRLWPEEEAAAGERVEYAWKAPWVPGPLAEVSRWAFFQDHRVRGRPEPPWRHALWNKQLTFVTLGDLAREVSERSGPEETLIGASTLAPLVALQAGRRIAADEADTNAKRFTTNQWSETDLARKACADRVRWLVAAPRSRFEPARVEQDPLWSGLFRRDREFQDPGLLHRRPFPVVLFRLRDDARLPDGTPCRPETSR